MAEILGFVIGKIAYLMSSFKQAVHTGTIELSKNQFNSLQENVTVLRDKEGVPHIYAKGYCLFIALNIKLDSMMPFLPKAL